MRQYLLDLYEIQKIDLEIREQQKRQEALPTHLRSLENAVAQLHSKIAQAQALSLRTGDDVQKLRHGVDEEIRKIRKWESRLNDIRNQREYQALSRETEGSKRANRDAEEKLSELMKSQESLDSESTGLKEQLEAAQSACEVEKQQVEEASAALDERIASERQRRDLLMPRIPKALYRKYDAIRNRRLGMGLSMVVAGCCQGCNMKLPPQLYNILQRGDSIEQCPSCHRLIFWENLLEKDLAATSAASDSDSAAAHA